MAAKTGEFDHSEKAKGRPKPSRYLRGTLTNLGPGLGIGVMGYGDQDSADGFGEPIYLEFYEGKLVLRVWADINQSDPTHVIDLEGARLTARKEEATE